MSLGSSASFRRIVSSRDTSTTESEIPSFRDTKPHESWELVPLDELCKAEAILAGTSSLRAKRSNLVNRKKDCHTPLGFAMTTVACTFCSHFHVKTGQKFPRRAIFTYTQAEIFLGGSFSRTLESKIPAATNFHVKTCKNRFASTLPFDNRSMSGKPSER